MVGVGGQCVGWDGLDVGRKGRHLPVRWFLYWLVSATLDCVVVVKCILLFLCIFLSSFCSWFKYKLGWIEEWMCSPSNTPSPAPLSLNLITNTCRLNDWRPDWKHKNTSIMQETHEYVDNSLFLSFTHHLQAPDIKVWFRCICISRFHGTGKAWMARCCYFRSSCSQECVASTTRVPPPSTSRLVWWSWSPTATHRAVRRSRAVAPHKLFWSNLKLARERKGPTLATHSSRFKEISVQSTIKGAVGSQR